MSKAFDISTVVEETNSDSRASFEECLKKEEISAISSKLSNSESCNDTDREKQIPDSSDKRLHVFGIRFMILFSGLFLGFFMAALDTTIVVTAVGSISSEFNAADQIGWVGSAYLLTISGFQPVYCALGNIIGQKYAYAGCTLIFILGSILCAVSNSMNMLIISRAVQGVGGAGLLTLVLIIICSLMDTRERAVYQGFLGAALGSASLVGPILGGFLADHNQWRWCFYINVFMGAVVIVIITTFCDLPLTKQQIDRLKNGATIIDQLRKVDYASVLLLMPGSVCFLVGLQLGGDQLSFDTPHVIVLLSLGVALILTFIAVEIRIIDNPIFPRRFVLSVGTMSVLFCQFMGGIVDNVIIYFVPLNFQVVKGDTAVQSALELLSFFITAVVAGLLSGVVVKVTGHYRFMLWGGTAFCIIGSSLLQTCTIDTLSKYQYVYLALLGLGIGTCKNIFIVAGQAAVPHEDLSTITSHGQFMRLLGGAFGVNFAAVLFRYYSTSPLKGLELSTGKDISLNNLLLLNQLPDPLRRKVRIFCLDAFNKVYLLVVVASSLAFIASLFIRKHKGNDQTAASSNTNKLM